MSAPTDETARRRDALHPAAERFAAEARAGLIGRREFLTRATSLGVTVSAAYGLLGLAAPVHAQEEEELAPNQIMRIQQDVRAVTDPRRWDWTQIANVGRGWLEYLVRYDRDGSFVPMLLESWEVNDDATAYSLHLRADVEWNNGDAFTADQVVALFHYWADRSVPGNSMAARLTALTDPETGELREDAVTAPDDMTVELRLSHPDITLIPSLADYPAAVVHPDHDPEAVLEQALGTGPYLPAMVIPGERALLIRNDAHRWWGADVPGFGVASLAQISFVDLGPDPRIWLQALDAGEVDILYQSVDPYIGPADTAGFQRSDILTGATLVLRFNQRAEVGGIKPYADLRLRRALQLAVDNAVVLELGYRMRGEQADNFHVAPIHPEYADIGRAPHDPSATRPLLEEAGLAEFEHDLVTLDDSFNRDTGDAMAAQMRDAGALVRRTVLPGSVYFANWRDYPLSVTEWNHRPLGVQNLALAYRSGADWNDAGYANPDFDAALNTAMGIADAEARRGHMAAIQQMLLDDAVVIQPFWRMLFRHSRRGVVGAEMHPAFEIYPAMLGWAEGTPSER